MVTERIRSFCDNPASSAARTMARTTALSILTLALFSCPHPLNDQLLSTLEDLQAPRIVINTPVQGATFESTVTVTGTVVDLDREGTARTGDAATFIRSLSYDIVDADNTITPVTVAADGSFSFTFPSADKDAQFTLVVYATDTNGNTASQSIILVPDTNGPFLTITAPQDYAEYGTVLTIAGTATNSMTDASVSEVNTTIHYSLPGTAVSGEATIGATGAFSATVNVSAVTGTRTIEITATDLNDNETTAVVTITKPLIGGDISGFTVTPGNKKATISWNPVQGATSYTLFEANFGAIRTGITSPYVWTGLENGELYDFQLTANLPDDVGTDAVSASVEKMPLSPLSLAPRVSATGYRSITLEWATYSNVTKYSVSRSLSPGGPWQTIRNVTTTTLTDTGLEHDTEYFYRIAPVAYPDVVSASAGAVPGRFRSLSGAAGATPLAISANPLSGGDARDVTISGNYLYMSDNFRGLAIFDISDPASPVLKGSWSTNGPGYEVTVSGNYAYIADDSNGLLIFDVSDPANAILTGEYRTTSPAPNYSGVAVAGNYAYLANGVYGVTVLNVSDPNNPAPAGSFDTAGNAIDVAVSGNYAYVADSNNGLVALDISNPSNITVAGSYDTAGNAVDVAISGTGNLAYVADGSNGLEIVTISTPGSMGSAGHITTTSYDVLHVDVSGEIVAVSSSYDKNVRLYDIGDTGNLVFLGEVDTQGTAYSVALHDSYVYVANGDRGLTLAEIATPSAPEVPNPPNPTLVATGSTPRKMAYRDGQIWVAGGDGVTAYNAHDPSNVSASTSSPVWTGVGGANDIALAGSYAYVATNPAVYIIDTANPAAPEVKRQISLSPNSGNAIIVRGSYAYVAYNDVSVQFSGGLAVLDVGDLESAAVVRYIPCGTVATWLTLDGDYLYMGGSNSGNGTIHKFDLTDPADPSIAASTTVTGHTFLDGAVVGTNLFLASGSALSKIDTALSGTPTSIFSPERHTSAMTVSGTHLYLAEGTDGIMVVDVAVPTSPARIGSVDPSPNTQDYRDILVAGSYAFALDINGNLYSFKLWEDME